MAAIVDNTVVTSPNADYVPEILHPSTEVKLCADLRYGPDDATLWPQPYLDNYLFLPVFLRRCGPRVRPTRPLSAALLSP